ncbi:MAG: hypothetical protein AAF514_14725 [Verrucomicrobiota bacterium]
MVRFLRSDDEMCPLLPLHDQNSAPETAVGLLNRVDKAFGLVPNLERTMATAPLLLQAYTDLSETFEETSFDPLQRQIIFQTINREHGCLY